MAYDPQLNRKLARIAKTARSRGGRVRKALYAKLTARDAPTHCAHGHKHTLDNCKAAGKRIICGVCEEISKQETSTKSPENETTHPAA